MQRARRYRIVSIVLGTTLSVIIALTACSDYGEGERCELLNNSDDCASGLVCTARAQVNAPYNTADRCCPLDRATASHPACTLLQNPITADAAPLDGNSGPGVDATIDSPIDSPLESTIPEAGPDADAADADGG